MTLKKRALRAGGWTVAGHGLSQLIRFGSNLLMTRLLLPELFGVMAIAYMIMYGLALFSDVGLRQSIVQSKRGNDATFLNTAWSIQILRGALIWVIALAVSIFIALANHLGVAPSNSVYAHPVLPYVIAILSISAFISGFESTKLHEASRGLLLNRITQIEIASQLAGLLCMYGWVVIDRSIWALVAGGLSATLARMILSHAWMPGTSNRLEWDNTAFKEIIHFGKWIFLSSILGFLVNSGDRLLLGGWLTTPELGVYVIAFFIFKSILDALSKIINDVAYPSLSEIARERPANLKSNYYRFQVVITSFTYLCSGILMISGQTLIGLLYDPRYSQAGWMLEILAAGLIAIPFRLAAQCFMALGMPRLLSHIITIQLVAMYLFIPIGFYFFGLTGALWGFVLSFFSTLPPTILYQVRWGIFDLKTEFLLLPIILVGMILGKALNLVAGY